MNINFKAHCGGHTFFGREEPGCFHWLAFQVRFEWASPGFVHSDDSSKKVVTFPLVPVHQGLYYYIEVPLLHLGTFMGYPTRCKFVETHNVVRMWSTVLWHKTTPTANSSAVNRRSASNREARSWTELFFTRSSYTEVVLNGIPAFLECFNPSCHCAIWQRCIATCFKKSLKTFLCTMKSCHFNFDLGTLL